MNVQICINTYFYVSRELNIHFPPCDTGSSKSSGMHAASVCSSHFAGLRPQATTPPSAPTQDAGPTASRLFSWLAHLPPCLPSQFTSEFPRHHICHCFWGLATPISISTGPNWGSYGARVAYFFHPVGSVLLPFGESIKCHNLMLSPKCWVDDPAMLSPPRAFGTPSDTGWLLTLEQSSQKVNVFPFSPFRQKSSVFWKKTGPWCPAKIWFVSVKQLLGVGDRFEGASPFHHCSRRTLHRGMPGCPGVTWAHRAALAQHGGAQRDAGARRGLLRAAGAANPPPPAVLPWRRAGQAPMHWPVVTGPGICDDDHILYIHRYIQYVSI